MPHLTVALTNARQANASWCWAAVASNVYDVLNPAAPMTQCEVATAVKQNCAAPAAADLQNVLTAIKVFSSSETTQAEFFEKIVAALTQGVPVCAEVGFTAGPHHFVAIVGVDSDSHHVWIADPFPGGEPIEFAFDDFRDRYAFPGNGTLGAGEKDGTVTALFLVHKP